MAENIVVVLIKLEICEKGKINNENIIQNWAVTQNQTVV